MDAIIFFERVIRFLFEDEKIDSFEDKLLMNNSRMKNLNGFIKYSIFEGIFFMIGVMIVVWNSPQQNLYIILGGFSFFIPFILNYLFHDIVFERNRIEKEFLLPDLLLEASVFCDESNFLGTIKRISTQDFPLIGSDFKRIYNEICNGSGIEEAIERAKKRNKSKIFSSTMNLFLQGYHSGAKMSELFKESAENILEMQAVLRERGAIMLINKYTLILAAGLIVPGILGLIVGLVSGLSFDALGEMSIGLELEERKRMLELTTLGTNIYLVEYALLSSFFLALQEGNKKNFWIYGAILLTLSITIFTITKNM
jgi:hypothetical protein